jgi:charged multivesicular body protein 3
MLSFQCYVQALAKELVRSRRAVNRLYENKAQLNSVSMHLGEIVGMILFYLGA